MVSFSYCRVSTSFNVLEIILQVFDTVVELDLVEGRNKDKSSWVLQRDVLRNELAELLVGIDVDIGKLNGLDCIKDV